MNLRKLRTEGNLNPLLALSNRAVEEFLISANAKLSEIVPPQELDALGTIAEEAMVAAGCSRSYQFSDILEPMYNIRTSIYKDEYRNERSIRAGLRVRICIKPPQNSLGVQGIGTGARYEFNIVKFQNTGEGELGNHLITERMSREKASEDMHNTVNTKGEQYALHNSCPAAREMLSSLTQRLTGDFYDTVFAELQKRSAYVYRGLLGQHHL